MSTYNSFPSLDSGNFRISKANPYLKSVNMPAIDNSTYFRFGKAYTPAYKNNFSWQQDLFDYNDPLAINSVVDAVFNSEAKRQRYKLGDNILADVVATVPALLELTYNSSLKPYVTNIKHAIESDEYGVGEALGNASWAGVLNTLMNVGETLDVLANPVKAAVITTFTSKDRLRKEGKATNTWQAVLDSVDWGGRGRINYDYDMVPGRYYDGLGNIVLELVSDPFNWISWGASSGIKGIAKEVVEGAVESTTKTVVKEATQEAVEQASKSVAKEITQETAERVAKEAAGEVFDTLSKRQQNLLIKNTMRALRDGNLDEAADIISTTVKNTLNGVTTGPLNKIRAHKWAGINKAKFSDEYADSLVNKITATTLENIDSLKRAQKLYNFSEGTQKLLGKSALITSAPGLIGSYKGIKYGMHAIEQHAAKLAKDAKLDTIEGIADAIAKAQEKFGTHADADVRKHLIDFYQSKGYSKVVANHLTKNTIAKYTTQAARASALQYRQLVTNLAVFKSKYDDAMKTLVDADISTRVKTLQPIYEELADTVSNAEQMLTSLKELRKTNMFSDTIEDYIKVLEDVVADTKADSPYKKTLQELISEMDDVGQRIQKLVENPRAVGTVKKYKAIQHFDSIDIEARKEVLDALNINDYASVFANTEENIISALSEMYKRNVFTITKNAETVDVQAFIEDVLDCYDILLDGANIPNKVRIILRHKAVSDEFKKLITEYVQFYFIKNKELCAQLNELLNRSGAKISDILTDAKKLFQESDKLLSQKRAGILPALLKSVPPKYSAHHAAMQHTLPELMSKLHDVAKTNKALAHVDLHTVTGTLLIDDIDKSLGVLKVLDELRALEKSWSIEQSIEHAKDLKLKGYDYTPISRGLALPYNIRYSVQERFNNLYEMSNFKKHITAATREDVLDSIDSLTRAATNDFRFVSAEDVVKTIDLYESKAISDTFDKVYKTAKPHKDFEVPVSKLAEQAQEDIAIIKRAYEEDPLFLKHLQDSAHNLNDEAYMPFDPIEFIERAEAQFKAGVDDATLHTIINDLEILKKNGIQKYSIIEQLQANADMYGKSTTKEVFTPVGALRNPMVKQYVETTEIEYSLESVSKGFKEDITHAAKLLEDKTRLLTRGDLKGLSMLQFFKGKKIEKLGELSKAFEIDKLTGKYTPEAIKTAITDVERCVQLYEARLAIEMCDAVGHTGASRLSDLKAKYGDLLREYNVTDTEVSNYIKEHMSQALGALKDTPELYTVVEECRALLQKSVNDMQSSIHLKSITKKLNDIKDIACASELDENVRKALKKYIDTFSKDDNIKLYFNASEDTVHNAIYMSPPTQRDLYDVSKRYYNLKPNGAVEGLVSARKEAEAGIKVYAASLSKVFTSSQIRNIPEVGALVKAWANKDISNPVVELLQKYKGQITVEDSPLYHAYQTITDTLDRAVFLDEVSYKLAQIPDDALPKEIRFALVDALHSNTGSKVAVELLEDMPKFIDKLCEKARVQLLCRKSKFKYSLDAIQDTMHDMFPGNDDIVKAVQDLIDEAQKTGTNAHDALFDVKVTEALMDYVDELHTPKEFADSHIRVTFDIETTGTNPADGQLLQIAARCTIDGKVYEFNTLVKADTHVAFDLEAKLTGMKTTDRDAVTKAFEQKFMADANGNEFTGLEAFYNWLTDMQKTAGEGRNKILLCGQNIDNFDIDFIKQRLDFLTSRKANASLTNLKGMLDNADTFDTLIAYYNRDGVPYLTNVQRDFIQQTFSEYFKKLQGADWTQRIKFGEYLDGDFVSACDDFCKIIKSDEVYRYGADLATAGINETSELSKLVSDIRETFKGIRENNADYSTYRAFIGEHELNIMSRLYNLEDGQLMVSPKLLRDMRSVSAFYELPEVMSETDADILTHFVKKIKNNREYIRCSSSIKKSENFLAQVKEVIKDLIDNKGVSVPSARSTGENTARLCYEAYNDGKDCVALLKTMTYKQGSKKALVESLDTLLKEGKIDLNTYDIIRRNCDDVYNKTKLAQSAAPDVYLTDMHDTAEALEDLAKNPHKGLDAIITNRNLWSAGEASSKALLRSTCDNFKTIAKILEPMDVKEAAAITESIKNAGALFTAHQLQDLVNKTADDLLKELHLSAGVKVVHTDYKAISNEVLDAWRANGILCEEVVNDMGGTSAYTYWIVADKSKYDYAKLIELGKDNKINPVFIDDITGNAEIDRLLVDNRNTLAKHNPTLGATDGSRITDAIYSRVYAACPESLKGNLLTVEELHNAKFFDKNYCNHMVIGDAASHKQYNLLYTDDVTMSHRFNIQDAVAQQEAVIKYTECFMNSDMSLRTGALFKDLPAATKLEIIRNSEGCKVAFLAPNKHAKYGYEIRTMDVYNLKTLKLAEDVDAVILPQMTILTMQRVVNKYEMPAIMKILTIPAMIYKCGYLGSLGFLFRNLTGGLINNTIAAGSPLELPHTVKHWFNTLKLYREYNVVCNKITALGTDAADVLHKLSDYGTVKRVITELAQNGEIKMLDPASFMDVHKFIRHGPSAGLCKSVQDTLAAFTEAAGGKQYDDVLNKAINKTAEATSNLPILKQINTANGWIEQTLRLSLYLQEVERGSSVSQAIAKVIKTHFDYSTKPLYMHYAETIVPFLSFTMNNLEFYADTFNRFGWFAGTVVDAFKPNWDFDALSDPNHKDYYSYDRGFDWGDLVSTRSKLPHSKISMARLYHIMSGNIILPTEKDVDYYNGYTGEVEQRRLSNIFKLNPPFMDAFNFLTSPLSSTTERILPYYRSIPELALKLLNEEAAVSDVELGLFFENLPIIGPVLQRTGFSNDIVGRGAENKNMIDKIKDSGNPLLAMSSLFGAMYEKPAVTYSNSNRWGGVKKYNRARYFKLTQPGTTKQGSHRSAHPSNYRKGIYDMSSKSELDKRMYIASNPNIRYRIRDYYRRYI